MKRCIFLLALFFSVFNSFSQKKINLIDGRTLLVNSDGTCHFIPDSGSIVIENNGNWKYSNNSQLDKFIKDSVIIIHKNGTWGYPSVFSNKESLYKRNDGSLNYQNLNKKNDDSFNLVGRSAINLPRPNYNGSESGRVVVAILVDRKGNVIKATSGIKGSTTLEKTLLDAAKNAALITKFKPDENSPSEQNGTITYSFFLE